MWLMWEWKNIQNLGYMYMVPMSSYMYQLFIKQNVCCTLTNVIGGVATDI